MPGDEAFRLYDTWGLPLDFIEDLAGERKLAIDREAFDRAMGAQRDRARARSAFDDRRGDEFAFSSDAGVRICDSGRRSRWFSLRSCGIR